MQASRRGAAGPPPSFADAWTPVGARGHGRDWQDLSEAERAAERARCRHRAATTGVRLNAVVTMMPPPPLAPPPGAGLLDGMPYVAKDMFDRPAWRATWGGVRPDGPAPARTAEVLERLDAAGAEQIAVAAMTELAYEPSGFNAGRGWTRNPWHPDVVCGGSSSGPAALVAAGCAVLGVGSDTAGSVRIPASCCGLTGLKPGRGTVPDAGAMALAPSLDTIGLFARSARELELAWPAISAADTQAPGAAPRRGVVLAGCVAAADAPVQAAMREAVAALDACGVALAPADPRALIEDADRHALLILAAESARQHPPERFPPGLPGETLRKRLAKGLAIPDAALAEARAARTDTVAAFLAMLGEAAVAVLPTLPCEAPLMAACDPRSASFAPRVLYRLSAYTRFVNFLGLPALSLPCGFDARGVPIGLQLIGRPGAEADLLALAVRMQRLTDWHGRVPPEAVTDPPEGEPP